MITIDYQALVTEYNDALFNVLRGFRPKYEFLEMWVPDTDPHKSIINLLEAAQLSGEHQVSLALNATTLTNLDVDALSDAARELGQVDQEALEQGLIFKVFALQGENSEEQTEQAHILANFNALYCQQLSAYLETVEHEGSLLEDEEHLLLHANQQGVNLFVSMDTEKHRIVEAAFSGTSSDIERALLSAFCQLIEGLPIQEAHDHGLLKLEYHLRDKNQPRPVAGILNVFNIDPAFQLLNQLIRQLYRNYQEKTGYRPQDNFYDDPPTKNWILRSENDKIAAIQSNIDAFMVDYPSYNKPKVLVQYIQKTIKLHISLQGELTATEKANLLLQLEQYLRRHLEPKLQLYLEPHKDTNQLRINKLKQLS